jgi:hypothetical protein
MTVAKRPKAEQDEDKVALKAAHRSGQNVDSKGRVSWFLRVPKRVADQIDERIEQSGFDRNTWMRLLLERVAKGEIDIK